MTRPDAATPPPFIRRRAPLLVAVAYLLLLAPLAFLAHRVGSYGVETDFFWSYAPQARTFLQDGTLPIDDFRGPLYPLTLAAVRLLLGDFFRAGVAISLLSAALTLGLLYAIVARLWTARAAYWTVLLTAVNPVFALYAYQAGTDMLYVALAFAAMTMMVRGRGVWGGVLGGLAYLTRYTGISLLAVGLFHRKRLFIALAFLLTIAPWGLRCLVETGDFFYNRNYLNFAINVHAEGAVVGWDETWWNPDTNRRFTSFYSVFRADPLRAAAKVTANIGTHAWQDTAQAIGFPAALLALCGLIFIRPNPRQRQFLLFGAMLFAINLLALYEVRYSLGLIPFYALLTVLGWQGLWSRLSRRTTLPAYVRNLPLALIVLSLTVWAVAHSSKALADYTPHELPAVAADLLPRLEPGIIAARKPHIAWALNEHYGHYPAFPFVALPKTDIVAELRRRHVDYLYLGPNEWHTRPDLRPLWQPQNAPSDFNAVYYRPDLYVTVYQLLPDRK